MTSTAKTTAATDLTLAALVDGESADASDVLVPLQETETEIDGARETVSVSATDTHVKTLDSALAAGSGVSITKLNAAGDEQLQLAVDGATITGLNASTALGSGVVAHERGGLEADVSAYAGLLKISGGATAQAVAETDYVTPSGAGTLANKTLTTPAIASFANATHDHTNAAGGGKLTSAAIDSETATNGYVLTANGSGGVSWAAAGGGGAQPVDITVTAGENLALRDVVFISAGVALKVDIDASPPLCGLIRGIVNEAGGIANGASGSVRILGEVTGFTGLTPWGMVYASATAGGYTQTKPTPTDGGAQIAVAPIGYAVSASAIMVTPNQRIQYMKRATTANDGTITVQHHPDAQGRERMVRGYVVGTLAEVVTSYDSPNRDSNVLLKVQGGYTADRCVGGTPSASSTTGGNIANLFDDTLASTSWQTSNALPQWIEYDFGEVRQIRRFVFTHNNDTYSDWSPREFEIQYYDGSTWQTAQAWVSQPLMGNSEVRPYDVTNTYSSSRWRIYITGRWGGGIALDELEMMEFYVTRTRLAQSVTFADAESVASARLWLRKVGAPTGTLTLRVETDNAGSPSGSLVDANATATLSEASLATSYGWANFVFPSVFNVSASTPYWLVLSTSRAESPTDYVHWGADGSTPSYAGGEMKAEIAAAWTAESKDAIFEISAQGVSFDEPCVMGRWSGGTRDVGVRFDDGTGADGNTKTTFKNVSGGSLDLTVLVELA